jgi:hypothetical protein
MSEAVELRPTGDPDRLRVVHAGTELPLGEIQRHSRVRRERPCEVWVGLLLDGSRCGGGPRPADAALAVFENA